jgi:hypothetical protein
MLGQLRRCPGTRPHRRTYLPGRPPLTHQTSLPPACPAQHPRTRIRQRGKPSPRRNTPRHGPGHHAQPDPHPSRLHRDAGHREHGNPRHGGGRRLPVPARHGRAPGHTQTSRAETSHWSPAADSRPATPGEATAAPAACAAAPARSRK